MKPIKNLIALCVFTSVAFILFGCMNNKSESDSKTKTDVNFYAVSYSDCSEALEMSTKTYCVHEVIRVTPYNGDCNKYAVGDKVCINCNDEICPTTTKFFTDDGVWLRACIVETRVVNRECRDIWPRGTCKYYVTLAKLKE